MTNPHYYENPGHHDLNGGSLRYRSGSGVLPSDHVNLFENSVVHYEKKSAKYIRYAVDSEGNYHRFMPHTKNTNTPTFHWAGQTNGKDSNGNSTKDFPAPPSYVVKKLN